MNPRRSNSEFTYHLPQLWVTGRASDCLISSVESENSLVSHQQLPEEYGISKANGHDFDEFSTNVFYIYIYGQARQYTYLKYCNLSLY